MHDVALPRKKSSFNPSGHTQILRPLLPSLEAHLRQSLQAVSLRRTLEYAEKAGVFLRARFGTLVSFFSPSGCMRLPQRFR